MWGWGRKKLDSLHQDKLHPDVLVLEDGWLQGTGGIPSTVDSCAYEPVQKLLAVGTWDGRVKLYGRAGVEHTMFSNCHHEHATRQLAFLVNRGVLVRVAEGGFVEAWSLGGAAGKGGQSASSAGGKRDTATSHIVDLCSIKVEGDQITCVAAMRRDPVLLLGCGSGTLRFAALVGRGGTPAPDCRPAHSMHLLQYRVPPTELNGTGGIKAVAVRSLGPTHVVLVLFFISGVSVWDIRGQALLATLNPVAKDAATPALRRAGKIQAVAWLVPTGPTPSADFATGHDNGDVLVWRLPPVGGEQEGGPTVACKLRVVPAGADPVRSLHPLLVGGRRPALLVCGGQGEESPDGLAILQVVQGGGQGEDGDEDGGRVTPGRNSGQSPSAVVRLPYVGPALSLCTLPTPGAAQGFEDAAQVLQVLETAQLAVHDMAQGGRGKPMTVTGPALQLQGEITCMEACTIPWTRPNGMPLYTLTVSGLRHAARSAATSSDQAGTAATAWPGSLARALTGGAVPKPSSKQCNILCTGFKTGVVHLWDASSGQPVLLGSAPSTAAAPGTKPEFGTLRAVTALEVVPSHGILITGHQKGEVRVYQFSDKPKQLEVVTLGEAGAGAKGARAVKLSEEAGMQLKLRSTAHGAEVVGLAYAPSCKAVVCADKQGEVSVIDLAKPALLWSAAPLGQPCSCACIATIPAPPKRDRAAGVLDEGVGEGAACVAVVLVGADTSTTVVALDSGQPLGKNGEVRPKNRSLALLCQPLDEDFQPTWLQAGASSPRKRATAAAARKASAGGAGSGAGGWKSKLHGGGKLRAHNSDEDDSSDDSQDSDAEGGGWVEADGSAVTATNLLLVSDHYLRIYSMAGLVTGDRTTLTKVASPHPLVWAATFHVEGAPGVLALTQPTDGSDPAFLVYSLPSLSLICQQPVPQCCAPRVGQVGHPAVAWDGPSGAGRARRCVVTTRQGTLLLLAANNEVLQCVVSDVSPGPVPPASVYDWEVAQAAWAASNAAETAMMAAGQSPGQRPRRRGADNEDALEEGMRTSAGGADAGGTGAGGKKPGTPLDLGRQLGDVFSKVTAGVTKVYEGTSKGLATVAKGVESGVKGVGRLFLEDAPDALAEYDAQHPELLVVLAQSMGEEKPRRGRRNADVDDGIPVTAPQPLVVQGSAGAAIAARAASAATATSGAGGASGRHDTGTSDDAGARSGRGRSQKPSSVSRARAAASEEGFDSSTADEAPSPRAPKAQHRSRDRSAKDREGSREGSVGAPTTPREGRGSSAEPRGAEAGGSRRVGSSRHRPEPQEKPAASEDEAGAGEDYGARTRQLAQDMKAQLLGGAQAIVGSLNRMAQGSGDDNSPRGGGGGSSSMRRQGGGDAPSARDRTASEIKRQYGRPGRNDDGGGGRVGATSAKVQSARDVALETRAKLHERGEKLSRLDDKAADMSNDAAGFADLARQLAEQQRNKKWWEL